jgi:hypothetical protein
MNAQEAKANGMIYVVNECYSDWDSSNCTAIMATFDKNKADAKVFEMAQRLNAVVAATDAVAIDGKAWDAQNPRPDYRKAPAQAMNDWYRRQQAALNKVRETFSEQVRSDISNMATDLFWEVAEIPFEE